MKQYLFILGLFVLITSVTSSCKKSTLDAMRDDELAALNEYITTNDLAGAKDDSGIYFKILETSTDTTQIRSGYRADIYFKFTLIDGTELPYLTTEDEDGHNYEEFSFFVDATNVSSDNYIQQIAGLHRALKLMKVGEKAFVVIPSELAFMALDKSIIGIPRFSTLLATVTVKSAYTPAQQSEL